MFSSRCKAIFTPVLKGTTYLIPSIGTTIAFCSSVVIAANTSEDSYSIGTRAALYTVIASTLAATGELAMTSFSYFYKGFKAYRTTSQTFVPLDIESGDTNRVDVANATEVIEAKSENNRCRSGLKSGLYTTLFVSTGCTAAADSLATYMALQILKDTDKETDDSKLQINYPLIFLRNSSLWFAAIHFLAKAIQEGRKSCAPIHTSHATLFMRQGQSRLLGTETREEKKRGKSYN